MREFVNVTTEADLDRVIAEGNVPVCRSGFFRAFGSATVHAFGSATVRAFGSATVHAFGSATVHAFGSATVRASECVAIHRHGDSPKVTGGVLIQVPEIGTAKGWCDYFGVKVTRGQAVLFKAVGNDFRSGHGAEYTPGGKTECDDWNPRPVCGGGLHFSPRPFLALRYSDGPRFVACKVRVADLVVIPECGGVPDKAKAPRCVVLHECDVDGAELAGTQA